MKRTAPLSILGLAVCLVVFLGLSAEQKASVEELTVQVTSDNPARVETTFESEAGLSVSLEEGVTPMTFTIRAGQFDGLITPKQDARITVKVLGGNRTATRSGSPGPVRVTKDGGDFGVHGVDR